ncbi:hypothetical protein Goshw_015631, partial [Gossypium schwendimanii]|nr:hypothetical protein [Gossypium schwendimanii]
MRHWKCTSRTEYYGNLDFDNRSLWHLRCWMIITKSTYGNCIRIGRDFGHTTSKCRKITVFTVGKGEAAATVCPKGTTWPFKYKKKGCRRRFINEVQTITRPIINTHTITRPCNSTDTVTRPSSSTDDTHSIAFSDDTRCIGVHGPVHFHFRLHRVDHRCIGQRRTRDHKRGCRGALLFTIPITVWVSNSFAVSDTNTSTVTILSRWLIVPTPTTRSPTRGTRISAGATTTLAGSWTNEESS